MTGYQLKITIKGSKPPIWRRVIVPEKISFADLDAVIECVFGGEHAHLYEFYFPENRVRISMQNDFDDNWEHTVLVEKAVPYENRCVRVIRLKGLYMIEDCGRIKNN